MPRTTRRRRRRSTSAATQHAAELGAPLVVFSTDYVFDGTKGEPYVESDAPSPLGAYGRTKLHGEAAAGERGVDRPHRRGSSAPTSKNFVRTMLRLGAERDEVAVVDDQRGCPTYVGHLAAATAADRRAAVRRLPRRRRRRLHLGRVRRGDLRGGRPRRRVRRITTAEFGARAPRPAYSVLRSEKGAPELPHWRDGLRACLRSR